MSQAIQFSSEPPRAWHMIRALGGIGILCSLLIVMTFQATLPVITRKKAEALERAIFNVLPGAVERATFEIDDGGRLTRVEGEAAGERLIFAGYDEGGNLIGVALEAAGQGFQDVIRLIYGYDPEREQVIGMEVLESKETPGLGDKILKDDDFLANFAALDAALSEDGARLRHPIESVKKGRKQHPWQIDGITGATISSVAVADIIRASAERTLPVLTRHRDVLRQFQRGPSDE
jgi:electron transport complex protein RnfG